MADFPRPQHDLASDHLPEVRRRAERPLESRRRDLDREAVEVVAQDRGDPFAEGVVDALRVVDVDREPVRTGQLEGEYLDARQFLLDPLRDLPRESPFLVVNRC